jgi:HK97 family phage major capsid protein
MSTVFHMPDGLAELKAQLERDWHRRSEALWRAGVPVADRHVLLKSVENIDGELTALRQDHGEKFRAMREAEKAVAEATDRGETITPDSPLFQALDTAGKACGEVEDRINAQEVVKARLVQQMGQAGLPAGGEGSEGRDDYIAELRAMRADLGGLGRPQPSAGQRLTSTDHYKELVASGRFLHSEYGGRIHVGEALDREELKAALVTGGDSGSAGAFITPQRVGYYPLPLRPLTILDLITIGQTDSDLIEYVRMLSFTNAAAEVPEAITAAAIDGTTVTAVQGGRKPESAMAFEIVQEAVSTIAHWMPATKRALADAGQMRTMIDGALRWGLGDRVEREVVAGDGIGDNLLGLLNQTGMNAITGTDSAADKIHRGITQNRLDSYVSTGVILNPIDAEGIWLSRENADGSGSYLFGGPANAGPRTLWGLPVAETPAMPQGTAIVGALQAAILWLREGTQVLASDSHADFFTRNLVAVLAEMRAGFGVPTPGAFAEVAL